MNQPLLAGIAFLLLIGSPFSQAKLNGDFTGYKVYRLTIGSQRQLDLLNRINDDVEHNALTDEVDFWTDIPRRYAPEREQSALIMICPAKQALYLSAFDSESIQYETTITDVATAIEEQSRLAPQDIRAVESGGMTWTAYHRYSTMVSWMHSLRESYPDLVQEMKSIGQSYEGRDLYRLKIGKARADGKTKPAIWMDAHIHAREWIAGATLTYMVNKMVTEYASNSTSRRMLDEIDWYIVPTVNPDGYEWTHTNNRMWRKTRRLNPFSVDIGCDANRNMDHKWMVSGATQTASTETYAGPFPYSEVENIYVTEQLLNLRPQVKSMISIHSAAQMWLLPWGYAFERPADYEDIRRAGQAAVDALTAVYGIRYVVGTVPDLLYEAAGGTLDWAKAKGGVKYTFTPELRDQGFGFLLPPNQIIPSGVETFEAINVIAQIVAREFNPTLN
ncbi:Carboxypeptidase B [Hypsibius exemplaris]|uniref:Carboxypeptidase B n=1 Tax=Hypsibius exemplaris TaxID=2072580 RepID=A0A1W0WSI2_HYPEX|nr:Carboxypeptidase B [Hypsibius exemplaris]